jgi:L-ascorbate metabolism protein UlaG (beta-lactamase superfamily)
VAQAARDHGFTDVRVLEPWQQTEAGDVTITAAPGKHGVPEITYVLQGGGRTAYFGGDTLSIGELSELPDRFGSFDLALLPTNGLCIRPMNDVQVVMNAAEAAALTAVLRPAVAIPHHYAFTSGWLGDRMITRSDPDPATSPRPRRNWPRNGRAPDRPRRAHADPLTVLYRPNGCAFAPTSS